MLSGNVYRLQKQELGIRGRDSGLWPTVTVSSRNGAVHSEKYLEYDEKTIKKRLSNLVEAVMYPSPCVTGLSSGSGNCEKANELYREGVINDEERRSFRAGNGGKLNPEWVCWLMSWSYGWTSLEPMDKFGDWISSVTDMTIWDSDPADNGGEPRVIEGCPFRREKITCLGNGQVPIVAYLAEIICSETLSSILDTM